MSGVYLDASALAKLILVEPESVALRSLLRENPDRFTSRVAQVEVTRAVLRYPDTKQAPVRDAFAGVEIIELDAALAARAATIGPTGLRSLDAIHLASALALGAELDAFITYDARQADAARAAGLEVVAPS
ncbi:MAG: type II toxin-antitoxin system VapC family toxin [Chloroflexi bacterium]|nr:type II toxin-antitoxin system VapC family toxin [Chloroflexota bacterium]